MDAGALFSLLLGCFFGLFQSVVYRILKLVKGSKRGTLPPIRDPNLLDPATVLAANIRTRKVKSETIVKAYIQRIKSVNPVLNAVVEDRFEDALKEAREADEYVLNSGKTPEQLAQEKPFLGVPFTAKDSVAIKDLDLSTGVVARKGVKAAKDCPVVSNMRSSGAIPLCVSNVSQLCMWGDASNKLFGITNNPYDLTRISGGSSGGEGALITSAASIMGIGNDIGGSIRIPSFCCGIFGHKPTRRVVSNEGQFPCSYETELDNYNCTGPMCRYAVDLLPMLKVLAGENASKLQLDQQVDMKTLKVYYTEDYICNSLTTAMDPELKESVRKVVKHLQSTYGVVAKKVSIPLLNSAWPIWLAKMFTAKTPVPMTDMVTKKPGEFNLYLETVKWFLRVSEHTAHIIYMVGLGAFHSSSWMKDTTAKNLELFQDLDKYFKELLRGDAVFIIPPCATTAVFHQDQLWKVYNYAYTGVFNMLGNPVTQCPTGLSSEGLPLGVQIVAGLNKDHLSLAVAQEIEQQFGGWRTPAPIL